MTGTRCLIALVLGLALAVGGCSAAPPPSPAPAAGPRPLPASCTSRNTDPEQAKLALAAVLPGQTVCLSGAGLTSADLAVTRSGTAGEPITVVADGATVRSMTVTADQVVVDGLTLIGGDGLTLHGRGLIARHNVIIGAAADGLVCIGCVDSLIESNTIRRADGTGIYLAGERITVRNNTVSESLRLTQGDADGIRFFGSGHRLTGNTIKDISASGYASDPRGGPHTDCFQTYNTTHNPPTFDVVITDNVCTNVDVQCLIATAEPGFRREAPPGQPVLTFERNTCAVHGSQAVFLENFPGVIVRDNHFSGPSYRAVALTKGSTDCTVVGNSVAGRLRPYEIDRPSQPGFQASGNVGG
ncbi:MAG TPA: right-handed parallel beta-helix repeat-containing protein [Pseudonocardiaceae bacterium]|nr:right-handed parallel beta-helix repeat-containing protein [Pseudonocardiaceae bacterium]